MSENQTFSSFGLHESLMRAISEMGYENPTPIQTQAIPLVLAGNDVMGAAQTGTGKTASFGLPLLERLIPAANSSMSPARHPVRALILTPTRELADQVHDNLQAYAKYTALRTACVFGGVDIHTQQDALRRGVEVLVATPGRLLDHVEQRNTVLNQVQIVVLDEADRMLDMGFLPDISKILKLLPEKRQSLMFSATFSPEIKSLAANFLRNPQLVEVARENSTAKTITQKLFEVHNSEKVDALLDLLDDEVCEEAKNILVFVNSKIVCRRLARTLSQYGIDADSIHGDKTQDERIKTLEGFKQGSIKVLVATDVAARGLDIADLPVVINFDVPFNAEDYVHRIGRTGRAGMKGLALTLMCPGADEKNVAAIESLIKEHFKRVRMDVSPHRRPSRGPRKVYTPPPVTPASTDPFFDEPYVPSQPQEPSEAIEKPLGLGAKDTKKKPKVAALLGGLIRR